jgi:rubrerythrin
MKAKVLFAIMIFAPAILSIGFVHAQSDKKLSEQTMQNLSTAMHGEAFAYAKYMAFAEHARKSGDTELADLLEKTAKTEQLEHFAEEAKFAGLVGTSSDNLKDAIKGESYETEKMYREFAQQAEQAGDHEVAQRFEEIRQDEAKHRDAFTAALNNLERKGRGGNR